jgi:hypothetical protein
MSWWWRELFRVRKKQEWNNKVHCFTHSHSRYDVYKRQEEWKGDSRRHVDTNLSLPPSFFTDKKTRRHTIQQRHDPLFSYNDNHQCNKIDPAMHGGI